MGGQGAERRRAGRHAERIGRLLRLGMLWLLLVMAAPLAAQSGAPPLH